MVGRAVVNHPAAFADIKLQQCVQVASRVDILEAYSAYCAEVEALLRGAGMPSKRLNAEVGRLLSPVFNLFAGEVGAERFQRMLKQFIHRSVDAQHTVSAEAAIKCASLCLDLSANERALHEYVALESIPVFDFGKRKSGPLQRHAW